MSELARHRPRGYIADSDTGAAFGVRPPARSTRLVLICCIERWRSRPSKVVVRSQSRDSLALANVECAPLPRSPHVVESATDRTQTGFDVAKTLGVGHLTERHL